MLSEAFDKEIYMQAILECKDLRVRYGTIQVVHGVDLKVEASECVVLLGANGAGKTSTLGGIVGLVKSTGTVTLSGRNISDTGVAARVGEGIGYVPEGRRNIFPEMTIDENMAIATQMLGRSRARATVKELGLRFPVLKERGDTAARLLSGGEQQMLAIAMALGRGPRVLLLDEPTQGLAPVVYKLLYEVFKDLTSSGMGILVAEQNLHFARDIGNRGLILSGGHLVHEATKEEMEDEDQIFGHYLTSQTSKQAGRVLAQG